MGDVNQLRFVEKHAAELHGPYLEVGSKDYGSTPDVQRVLRHEGSYTRVDLQSGPRVDLVLDLTAPFEEIDTALGGARFGAIFCLSVLEHCRQPFAAAANLTRLLAPGFGPLRITRTSEKTLLVEAQAGNILSTDTSRKDFAPNFAYFYNHFNSLFRPQDLPFSAGDRTQLSDLSAEVTAVDGGGQPTKVLFRFAVSLDNPALVWFKWTWKKNGLGAYSRFDVPAIGQVSDTKGPFGET